MHKIDFDSTSDVDKQSYATIFTAISISKRETAVSEWDDVVGLLRALKAIGTQVDGEIAGAPMFELKYSGALVLSRSERHLLIDYLKQPIWRPHVIEAVQALIKRIEATEDQPGVERVLSLVGGKDGE